MTQVPSSKAYPEDLSTRARRGDLPAEEQQALEQALHTSALLRVAHQVGRDFDEASRVRPGDDELILRASTGALARGQARTPRARRHGLAIGTAATLVIAAGIAAASAWISVHHENGPPGEPSQPSAPKSRPVSTNHPSSRQGPSDEGNPPRSARAVSGSEANRSVAAPPPHALESTGAKDPITAAGLFREANAQRRSGDLETARALYTELQTRFPDSNEARVSRVSLGKLLLSAGRSREAERQFERYLASGGGDLKEEALVGRAEALARLGESGEERRVLQELLTKYRSSVYAAGARQRLRELDAAKSGDAR